MSVLLGGPLAPSDLPLPWKSSVLLPLPFVRTPAHAVSFQVRVYEEVTRLQNRYTAFVHGEIDSYDARWTSGCLYIPGTDVRTE